jgi:hypothetical protein
MTKYEHDLNNRLRDPAQWPDFHRPNFLQRLDAAAERAMRKRTVEGHLAAVLIYHQLVEEMLRLLTRDSQFLVQVALRPWRIEFPVRHKQMFGQIQQELRSLVDFPRKERLLALADDINTIRVEVVHRLVNRGSLAGLARKARAAKRLYERTYAIFDDAHDGFRVDFHGFKKDLA